MTTTTGKELLKAAPDAKEFEKQRKTEARALNEKIKRTSTAVVRNVESAVDKWQELGELLHEAERIEIYKYVSGGYKSWTAWMKDTVQLTFSDRDERKALVRVLSNKGMSTRAIGGVLGVDPKTVNNDQRELGKDSTPDEVTGTDGKTYKKSKKQEPEPESPLDVDEVPLPPDEPPFKRRAFSEDFKEELWQLQNCISALSDLIHCDDRFAKARSRLAKSKMTDDYRKAIEDLDDLLGVIQGDDANG